ncbi:MAG: phosphate ABC transporter ATP-binding protein [Candidatus Latescibacterota bacterium]
MAAMILPEVSMTLQAQAHTHQVAVDRAGQGSNGHPATGIGAHISVRDLSVSYHGQQALKSVTVDIPARKITAIIGPSGCGKTTLLKSFNRLIDLQDDVTVSGQILVDGADVLGKGGDVTSLRRKMGLLAQRPQVLPMSIYDNVAYGPRIHGIRRKRRLDEIVEHYLKEASLWSEVEDRLHTSASRLSIGQQQRLCLARGLAVEPEIILGDEPTSALDPASSKRIEQRFLELRQQYTIVIVTHILRQAKRLADHVIFLYLGELVEHGPAEEVFGAPQAALTREYVGGTIS